MLQLAAHTSEHEVEMALSLLLESATVPTHEAVRELVQGRPSPHVPQLSPPTLELSSYDALLSQREVA